ncbi:hypothetical protein FHL15_008568 [Xylaria flabelliformis]|uniref:Uncharacterized protein n=1 Tax=Xylaria flabelliformis TaxID=2512241 RepID=A0A553HRK1_9PEZI|nr:hypothetical protein FHL15_008568 [Xylaria flabelliformis]
MSRQAISGQRHILRALSQWPKDTIRPEVQFQTVLQKRFEQPKLDISEEEQLRQANALYSLLENRYKRTVSTYDRRLVSGSSSSMTVLTKLQYPITGTLLQPKSNPTYFTDLLKELEEAPSRSWFDRLLLRIKGVVRLQ